ncbi:DNA glycosylase [Xylariomycetidae sp. FL2044]|nr:DNA glycosylase [Xylariomycetidae sp. FL2044]
MAHDRRREQAASEPSAGPPKEPSFLGRLQMKNFVYGIPAPGVDETSPTPRRSPRLQLLPTPRSATASPARTPAASAAASSASALQMRATPTKRKAAGPPDTTTIATTSPPTESSPTSAAKKKRPRKTPSYTPPSTYSHLPLLPDAIAPNLLILFIGLNPGLQTSRTGHAYAHPSNLFWKLLHRSGITPVRCAAAEDRTMPARFALGHTNIVARPTRSGAELSKGEMDDGVADLEAKCRVWRPEVACVTGKSIWESVFRVKKKRGLAKGEFVYGWQTDAMRLGADPENGWPGSRVFVAASTSGLAASLRPEEKERIWKELGDWCVARRREREEEERRKGDVGVGDGGGGGGGGDGVTVGEDVEIKKDEG